MYTIRHVAIICRKKGDKCFENKISHWNCVLVLEEIFYTACGKACGKCE
jgi:hypothetical protein